MDHLYYTVGIWKDNTAVSGMSSEAVPMTMRRVLSQLYYCTSSKVVLWLVCLFVCLQDYSKSYGLFWTLSKIIDLCRGNRWFNLVRDPDLDLDPGHFSKISSPLWGWAKLDILNHSPVPLSESEHHSPVSWRWRKTEGWHAKCWCVYSNFEDAFPSRLNLEMVNDRSIPIICRSSA